MGPDIRFATVAVLLGLAAMAIYTARSCMWLFAVALLAAPLPGFLVLRFTIPRLTGGAAEQADTGLLLSALACYLPPVLGALTAHLIDGGGSDSHGR